MNNNRAQEEQLQLIVNELQKQRSGRELASFLKGLLTAKEIEELSVRLRIVKLLQQGMPQHQIASKLKVGVATVTRGAKEIKLGHF